MSNDGIERNEIRMKGLRASLFVAALACIGGCRDNEISFSSDSTETHERRLTRLKLPGERLPRKEEEAILDLIDDMRGVDTDYLGRRKSEETLKKKMMEQPGEISGYLVQLLDDPQWDVRAATLRLLMAHGKKCPEAVTALVQVVSDSSMNAVVRKDADVALRKWSGKDFGYNAWGEPEDVKSAAARWKKWLNETGGYIFSD